MRGALLVVAGLWAGLVLAVGAAATLNFRAVDRALGPQAPSELGARLGPLGPDERRQALRHVASESNRALFALSGWSQAVLALAVLALAWPAGGAARGWALALAVLLAAQQLACALPMIELGRQMDFAARPWPAGVARRFGLLHGGYSLLELAKLALLAGLAWAARR